MSAMAKSLRAFQAALLIGWMALGAAGLVYARLKGIAVVAAWPVIAALLMQYPFYLVTAFPDLREYLAGRRRFPLYALAVSVLPYLMCCCGALPFQWNSLVRLAAMALALSLWYVVLPARPVLDLAFLTLTAAILLGRYFEPVYPPLHKEKLVILGHISLFVVAILALMLERRVPETGYGFIPTRRDWRIGTVHFLYFAAIGLPLALATHATHLIAPRPLWVVVGTFAGFLWFVSLTEEFFFRGVLQKWIEEWTASLSAGLIVTSVLFGLIHYWFRGWSWVPLGALLGFFCGRARNQAGGIRAAVVTHALVVTTWRAFFW
jgi:membrane protease YdiL (CAAX protease family)